MVILNEILQQLERNKNPDKAAGMKNFGIATNNALGVSVPVLREIAKNYKNNSPVALALWDTSFHEAKLLATMIADRKMFSEAQMDAWTRDFNSWDICDGACYNLFRYLPWAYDKIPVYAQYEEEFIRRTAFSLTAGLAIGDKKSNDKVFVPYFELIKSHSNDDRNFVYKAVNWSLRQIGKRSLFLREKALEVALELKESDSKTARWIGSDAFRELSNPKIIARIKH